jgi:hypothetical protein
MLSLGVEAEQGSMLGSLIRGGLAAEAVDAFAESPDSCTWMIDHTFAEVQLLYYRKRNCDSDSCIS